VSTVGQGHRFERTHPFEEPIHRHRFPNDVTLYAVGVERTQRPKLFQRFGSFSYDLEAEVVGKINDGPNNDVVLLAGEHSRNERLIDFDFVDGHQL
jgi:hypothetical protein